MKAAAGGPEFLVPRALEAKDLETVLPHRPPMLLIDRIPWIGSDKVVAVTRPLGLERNGVPRPADGTVAEALILEAVAQAIATCVIVEGQEAAPKTRGAAWPGVLAAIPEFAFSGRARAGARLTIVGTMERRFGRLVNARGVVLEGARTIGEGRMTIGIGLS